MLRILLASPHGLRENPPDVTAEQIAALPFYHRSPLFDEKEKATIFMPIAVTRVRLQFALTSGRTAQVLR